MKEIIKILNENKINYIKSDYAGYKSIIIKNKKYKIEIYEDKKGLVRDLQKIPYTWGIMGNTDINNIIEEIKKYFKKDISQFQLSLF